jgi:hypothetical protein
MTNPEPPVARLETELNQAIHQLDTLLMDPAATSQQIAAAETAANAAFDAYWPNTPAGQAEAEAGQ